MFINNIVDKLEMKLRIWTKQPTFGYGIASGLRKKNNSFSKKISCNYRYGSTPIGQNNAD